MKKLPKQLSQIQHLHHPCPICQSEEGAVLGTLKYALFDGSPIANTYNVVGCVRCGFVFCDTPSSQADYDRFYKDYFYSSAYLTREAGAEELQYLEQTLNIIKPYLADKSSRIFDLGCGTGSLLSRLHAFGYKNLYGVDLSSSCVELVNKKGGIRAEVGSLTNLPFTGIKADVIILCHLLEHVIDLLTALQGIADKVSENGLVYIEVPDAMKYGAFKDVNPLRFFYHQHVIHFDKPHLQALFEKSGFKQIKSGHRIRKEGELLVHSVWGIFRKSGSKSKAIKPDFTLANRVKNWFNDISLDKDGILENLAASKTPVYIWGIGIHVQMMLAMSPLGKCNIKYFIDKDERVQKKTINGKKVYPLDKLNEANEYEAIVIGAPMHSEKMYRYLIEQVGFKGQVIICGFGDVYLKSK